VRFSGRGGRREVSAVVFVSLPEPSRAQRVPSGARAQDRSGFFSSVG
jgi:hypothetical protein